VLTVVVPKEPAPARTKPRPIAVHSKLWLSELGSVAAKSTCVSLRCDVMEFVNKLSKSKNTLLARFLLERKILSVILK
jgi:hypothetical protein